VTSALRRVVQADGSARRRRLSLNAFVRLALEKVAAEERNELLKESYDALGSDREEADVGRFMRVQREAVRRG